MKSMTSGFLVYLSSGVLMVREKFNVPSDLKDAF